MNHVGDVVVQVTKSFKALEHHAQRLELPQTPHTREIAEISEIELAIPQERARDRARLRSPSLGH